MLGKQGFQDLVPILDHVFKVDERSEFTPSINALEYLQSQGFLALSGGLGHVELLNLGQPLGHLELLHPFRKFVKGRFNVIEFCILSVTTQQHRPQHALVVHLVSSAQG